MKTLSLRGRVFSGGGQGAKYIKLPWVRKQIEEKLGFAPFLGTLNMKLVENSVESAKALNKADGLEILPAEGFCRGKLFKACLMTRLEVGVVIPEVAAYPENIIEIIAPLNLREKLQLKDGDVIEVRVMF